MHYIGTSLAFHFESTDKKNEIYEISAECFNENSISNEDWSYQYSYDDDDEYNLLIEFDDFKVSSEPSTSEESYDNLFVPMEEQTVYEAEQEGYAYIDASELTKLAQNALDLPHRRLQKQEQQVGKEHGQRLKADTYHLGFCSALDWNIDKEEGVVGSGRRLTVQPWISVSLPTSTTTTTDTDSQVPDSGSWEWLLIPHGICPVLYILSAILVMASAAVVVASCIFSRKGKVLCFLIFFFFSYKILIIYALCILSFIVKVFSPSNLEVV